MLLDLFGKVLEMSLIGCYVIAIVLVIRLLLHKCERKYSYALWFVVFLNLCLPFSIEGPFSLIPGRLIEQEIIENRSVEEDNFATAEREATTHNMESVATNTGNGSVVSEGGNALENSSVPQEDETIDWKPVGNLNINQNAVNNEAPETPVQITKPQSSEEILQDLPAVEAVQVPAIDVVGRANLSWTVAGGVWLLGVIGIAGVSLVKGILLSKQLKKSRKGQGDIWDGVVLAEDISAPFLWGIWRPLIYLPADVEEEERIYILAHERYHKKRFDHITKPAVFAVVAIHWFNPLVWLAYALFVRDMEISCDEAVLARAEGSIKKQYASSLLKYAAGQNGFVLAPLTFGEPSLKSRIKNVLGYKKRGMVVTIAAICVVVLTACGLILRPQTEEPGEGNAGQDGKEPGVEVTQEPEATELPQTTQVPDVFENSPYSVYFQDILQARYEEKDGKYFAIENEENLREYIYLKTAKDYRPESFDYATSVDFYLEDGGVAKIQWLKLSEDLSLSDLSFDMSEEMRESGSDHNALGAVHYDEEKEQVYVVVSAMREAITWLICFSPENPTEYDIYEYEYVSWFGESCYIDGCIFLHSSSVDAPFVIDMETKEGRLCTEEYRAAKVATYEWSAKYALEHEETLGVYWMNAIGGWEDVDIFSARLMEAMDIFPGMADIYVASRNGEISEVMVVETQTGEVTVVKNIEEMTAVRPLLQEEIDWFNESYFNQGYLQEGTAALEGIRNQFLTHEYARPEDIDVSEVFYNGAGEEMTENDRLCISGEARWKYPLYTGEMVLLTELEHKEVAQIDVDVSRVSFDTMDTIMTTYTGLSTWGTRGMESLYFNKRDGVYYKFHGDTNTVFVQVKEGHYNTDGTISLYYVRNGSSNWIDEEVDLYVVVLRPIRNGYQFVSNQRVGASHAGTSGTIVEEKALDLSLYPEYFAEVLREVQASGEYHLDNQNVENVRWTDRFDDKGKVTEVEEYQYEVAKLELASGRVLENLSFDLKEAMQEGEMTNVICMEVFLKEAQDKVYFLLAEGTEREDWYNGGMIVVEASLENTTSYEVHTYPEVLGVFGSHEMLGESIYVYTDVSRPPYQINVTSWEGHYCEKELQDAKALITDFADWCEEVDGKRPVLWNYGACCRIEDVDIYYGEVSEDMEAGNPQGGIYTAYRDGVYLGALLIDMRSGVIYYTAGKSVDEIPYKLYAVENEKYNAVFEYKGLQYHYLLDMNTTNLFLRLGEAQTEKDSTGSWTLTPVYASNGDKEVELGCLRGKANQVFWLSDSYRVEPEMPSGERIHGVMGEIVEGQMTILPMQEEDMDGYLMYDKTIVQEPVTYLLPEEIEYTVLDSYAWAANTSWEIFKEHMSKTYDQVCFFVVKDGVILHIGEPYLP